MFNNGRQRLLSNALKSPTNTHTETPNPDELKGSHCGCRAGTKKPSEEVCTIPSRDCKGESKITGRKHGELVAWIKTFRLQGQRENEN